MEKFCHLGRSDAMDNAMDAVPERYKRRSDAELVELKELRASLDDALVHSDDDRIEAMFTALHHVARDQQIIVLTCRQRAFAALGGDKARVRIAAT